MLNKLVLLSLFLAAGSYGCDYADFGRAEIERLIIAYSKTVEIDPDLVWSVIQVESNFDPCAVSSAGAMGLMQLMPGTVEDQAVTDPFDPAQNIQAGTKVLAQLLKDYDVFQFSLAAYNAGKSTLKKYRKVPPYPETKRYVRRVMAAYEKRSGKSPAWLVWSVSSDEKN